MDCKIVWVREQEVLVILVSRFRWIMPPINCTSQLTSPWCNECENCSGEAGALATHTGRTKQTVSPPSLSPCLRAPQHLSGTELLRIQTLAVGRSPHHFTTPTYPTITLPLRSPAQPFTLISSCCMTVQKEKYILTGRKRQTNRILNNTGFI